MLKRTVTIGESAGVRSLVFNGSPSVEGLRTVRHRLRHWTSNPLVRVVLLRSSESGGEFFAGGDAADDESSGASGRHGAMRGLRAAAVWHGRSEGAALWRDQQVATSERVV